MADSLDSKTGHLSVKAHQVFVTYELAQLLLGGYLTAATAFASSSPRCAGRFSPAPPFPPGWSEMRYTAYCFVLPRMGG